jgi:MFS superfamily sulfate permease-like transporter
LKTDAFSRLRTEWLGNIRPDILAGLVVALALIPEAIAFSIIAGVDPKVGLYASFSIAVIVAITGGRPGMISAATAATAVLMDIGGSIASGCRPVETGIRHEVRFQIGDDRFCECPRYTYFYGAVA